MWSWQAEECFKGINVRPRLLVTVVLDEHVAQHTQLPGGTGKGFTVRKSSQWRTHLSDDRSKHHKDNWKQQRLRVPQWSLKFTGRLC